MQVALHHPEDLTQLQQQSRQERDAKQRDRYRAILLALEGQEAPVIARTLGRSRRFVQGWVYRYRDHGLAAVVPQRQTGRPPKLPVTKEASFKERFLAEPTEAEGVCTRRAQEAQRLLQKEFGVEYTLPGVYDLLHRLGLSCLVPRPRHRHHDPAQMQRWVEEAPLLSSKSPKRTPDKQSRSGSRTKRGSVSKEP
jgi:putative transposase